MPNEIWIVWMSITVALLALYIIFNDIRIYRLEKRLQRLDRQIEKSTDPKIEIRRIGR